MRAPHPALHPQAEPPAVNVGRLLTRGLDRPATEGHRVIVRQVHNVNLSPQWAAVCQAPGCKFVDIHVVVGLADTAASEHTAATRSGAQ